MGRHEQREQVFELLFRAEFNSPEDMPEQVQLFFEDEERAGLGDVSEVIKAKYQKIFDKIPELDRLLNEKTERWNTKRFGKVELTVLRLALYEILFDNAIPEGVAIDEAVVNGVLAKFVKKENE